METVQLDEGLLRTTAPNGLQVLTEHLPGVRSAAVGIWVRQASAHEPREKMGMSHLLEHMVFKGSERRTAQHHGVRQHLAQLHHLPAVWHLVGGVAEQV